VFDLHSLFQGFFLEYRVEVLVDFCLVAVVITGLAVWLPLLIFVFLDIEEVCKSICDDLVLLCLCVEVLPAHLLGFIRDVDVARG